MGRKIVPEGIRDPRNPHKRGSTIWLPCDLDREMRGYAIMNDKELGEVFTVASGLYLETLSMSGGQLRLFELEQELTIPDQPRRWYKHWDI